MTIKRFKKRLKTETPEEFMNRRCARAQAVKKKNEEIAARNAQTRAAGARILTMSDEELSIELLTKGIVLKTSTLDDLRAWARDAANGFHDLEFIKTLEERGIW